MPEASDIVGAIDAQRGLDDETHVERVQERAARLTDMLEPLADLERGILRGVEQDGPGRGDREAAEARAPGGDRDGEFEGEPAFAGLGRAADDADGAAAPERLDEPGGGGGRRIDDVRRAHEREGASHEDPLRSADWCGR